METGTVKFFNAQQGKRFGFVRTESGEELFFHFNDGEFIIPGKVQPEFSEKAQMTIKGQLRSLRDPQRDDIVIFNRKRGSGGWIASPWGYKSHYERALEIIAKRSAPTIYRVLETMNNLGKQPGEPKVLWEGSDLDDLFIRYPVPSGRQSPSADPLLPYWSDTDNIFEVRRWFERKTEVGWEQCPDPRW